MPHPIHHHPTSASRGVGLLLCLCALFGSGTEVGAIGRTVIGTGAQASPRQAQATRGTEPRLCLCHDDEFSERGEHASRWAREQWFRARRSPIVGESCRRTDWALEEGGAAFIFDEPIPDGIHASTFKTNVETATGGRVQVDIETGTIRAHGALTNYDRDAMLNAMPESSGKGDRVSCISRAVHG